MSRNPSSSRRPFRWLIIVLVLLCGLLVTPIPGKIYRGIVRIAGDPGEARIIREVEVKEIVREIKVREPLPERFVNYKIVDTARLWSGIEVNSAMEVIEGKIASIERNNPKGYTFDFKINLTVPVPGASMEELAGNNPHLSRTLPAIGQLVAGGKVSGFYHKLYEIKAKRVQQFITRLNAVPDRHNFYDCESILELQHPDSKQKVFFLQGDMDVVSDGSDGDRMPEYDQYIAKSTNYQPFTSYGWKKKTRQPNPLLASWQKKLATAQQELTAGKVRASRLVSHKQHITTLKREIADMKARSFLIAREDPFIVIPSWMRGYGNQNAFAPNIGDYAAVIFEDRVFPAIVGDTGPTWKVGEASLRLAREINPKASPYSRPVSKLYVSYLIFPGSRDPADAPDLDRWHRRVSTLLQRIGGLGEGVKLHRWSNNLVKEKQVD
ncbi:MAG: glycoside hydrolase family 75 protein [Verrucomicrobiales bacterium]